MPPSGAYAYGAGVVADTLLSFLKEAPCHDMLSLFNSGLATLTRGHPSFAWWSQLCLFSAPLIAGVSLTDSQRFQ